VCSSDLPELFIAPRGLITILLLFSIPENLIAEHFQEDITFMVIIATNLIIMVALIRNKGGLENIKENLTDSPIEITEEAGLQENSNDASQPTENE
ncbi:MAG: sodium:proton exchanger, partial [Vicingaceae bacterium]